MYQLMNPVICTAWIKIDKTNVFLAVFVIVLTVYFPNSCMDGTILFSYVNYWYYPWQESCEVYGSALMCGMNFFISMSCFLYWMVFILYKTALFYFQIHCSALNNNHTCRWSSTPLWEIEPEVKFVEEAQCLVTSVAFPLIKEVGQRIRVSLFVLDYWG